jgi:subtilase family serine protease
MRWFAAAALAALGLAAGASPAHEITFSVQLRVNMTRIDHDLAAGRSIASPAELGRRYGLPLASERRVEAVLRAHGIQVVATYPQRTMIELRASRPTIRRFFRGGVPAQLRPWVTGVLLSQRPVAFANDLPHGTLLPQDAALAYDVAPLRKLGIDGTGQTIAILSLSPFPANGKDTKDDISTFRKKFAPHGPDPEDVAVHGGGTVNDYSEDDLDIDVISGIAPGAQIVNYEAPSTAIGIVALFNHLVLDNRAKLASFSWGACNAGLPGAYLDAVNTALKLAALRGITVFVASGDSGSYDCQRSDFADHRLTVDFPASSPQVVAVGGTLLSVDKNGAYVGEAGWEDTLSFAGGGGGVNPDDDAPSWQAAAGVKGHRGLPDVSASASPDSGWLVRDYGHWDTVGGTSAATPFWAASMLLAQQLAQKQGVSKHCFLAPILYKLATTKQPYPGFHDVKAGGNRFYDAKPGWDYATGLGSPDVWNLARDLVAFLKKNPCPPGA